MLRECVCAEAAAAAGAKPREAGRRAGCPGALADRPRALPEEPSASAGGLRSEPRGAGPGFAREGEVPGEEPAGWRGAGHSPPGREEAGRSERGARAGAEACKQVSVALAPRP